MRLHYVAVQSHQPQPREVGVDSTRDRLVAAAEALFASRGIDAVSLREINRHAGAKNAVAVQYHFGDRQGVLRAIHRKHWPAIDAGRHALLDAYQARAELDLRELVGALVRPLAAKLADPDGGPAYLRIYAELLASHPVSAEAAPDADDSIQRWRRLVEPFLGADATRLHRRWVAIRFAAAEIGRRASTAPHADDRLFVSDLIDLVAALLLAPTSEETARLADERDASRRRRARPGATTRRPRPPAT